MPRTAMKARWQTHKDHWDLMVGEEGLGVIMARDGERPELFYLWWGEKAGSYAHRFEAKGGITQAMVYAKQWAKAYLQTAAAAL